jgi:hypothetical protein
MPRKRKPCHCSEHEGWHCNECQRRIDYVYDFVKRVERALLSHYEIRSGLGYTRTDKPK